MPVDLESPRQRRRTHRDPPVAAPITPCPMADDSPAEPAALNEGLEVTICLADQPEAERDLNRVTDRLWEMTDGTAFEVAAVHPLTGGAKLHFLAHGGGTGGDPAAALDLLHRIGARYRWVGVTRLTARAPSHCRH